MPDVNPQNSNTNIIPTKIGDYLTPSLIEYGTYVLCGRAVGDVRDGLKPVQRRLLWEAYKQKAFPNANFRKCAKIVGGAMGNWHPHGDVSIFMTLVGMTKDRYPLFEGHGNFGTPTDPPAAQRYVESRLSKFALHLFDDIDVMPLTDNYDGTQQEPVVLPARLPLALLNGFEGIAVGLSTNVPPHNLVEVVQALSFLLKNPNANVQDVLRFIQGPDYGSGILTSSAEDILEVYREGRGTLYFRCEYEYKKTEDHYTLEITGLAPQFNVSRFLDLCQKLSKEGHILYATDLSSSEGFRLVVGFSDPQAIKERVLPLLNTKVSYSFFSVENGDSIENSRINFTPVLSILTSFLDFRRRIEKDILKLRIERLEERAHIEEIKSLALKKLNKVIKELKSTDSDLKGRLAKALKISLEDADIICRSRVQSLAKVSQAEQLEKLQKLQDEIEAAQLDLADIDRVVLRRLEEMLEYGDERGTLIGEDAPKLPSLDVERYVSATTSGKVQRWFDTPTKARKWSWDYLVDTGEYVTIALSDGTLQQWSLAKLTNEEFSNKIVGLVSSQHAKMLLLCTNSAIVSLSHPQKVTSYKGTRTGALKQVVGFNDEDTIALVSPSYDVVLVPGHKLKGHQRGTTAKFRYRMRDIFQALVIPKGGELLDGVGNRVDITITEKKRRFMGPFFVAGDRNFVIQEGRKRILGLSKTLKFKDKITKVHIL